MISHKKTKNHSPLTETHTAFEKSLDGIFCRGLLSTSTPTSQIKKPIHGTNAKVWLNTCSIASLVGKGKRNMRRGNRSKLAFGERCL